MGGLALCPDFSSLADLCRVADFQFVQLLVVSMGMAYILHICGRNTEALDAFLPTLPLFQENFSRPISWSVDSFFCLFTFEMELAGKVFIFFIGVSNSVIYTCLFRVVFSLLKFFMITLCFLLVP